MMTHTWRVSALALIYTRIHSTYIHAYIVSTYIYDIYNDSYLACLSSRPPRSPSCASNGIEHERESARAHERERERKIMPVLRVYACAHTQRDKSLRSKTDDRFVRCTSVLIVLRVSHETHISKRLSECLQSHLPVSRPVWSVFVLGFCFV